MVRVQRETTAFPLTAEKTSERTLVFRRSGGVRGRNGGQRRHQSLRGLLVATYEVREVRGFGTQTARRAAGTHGLASVYVVKERSRERVWSEGKKVG